MEATNETKTAWPGGKVRISMPASVANDLDAFKKGVTAVAEKLGCGNCFSGVDCTFQTERNYVINEKLKVDAVPGTSQGMAVDVTTGASRGITVSMPSRVQFDLDKILKTIDLIGQDLGKHWRSGGLAYCCSGFDITLEQELKYMVDLHGNLRHHA